MISIVSNKKFVLASAFALLVIASSTFSWPSKSWASDRPIRIASKKFAESFILAEIMAQLIEKEMGIPVERKFGLGGTMICFEALKNDEIDLYPEYSGTALHVLLKTDQDLSFGQMNERFKQSYGLEWLEPFGFNNSYAIAMSRRRAESLGIEKYSDLLSYPELNWGLSYEYLNRNDGWHALKAYYGFQPTGFVKGIEHALSYEAVASGHIDLMDVYTTDAKILTYDLMVLDDDRNFFPKYLGAPLARSEVLDRYPQLRKILGRLGQSIDDAEMQRLNAQAEVEKKDFAEIAANFLHPNDETIVAGSSFWRTLIARTLRHLKLTFLAVLFASLVGIPLGIVMMRVAWLARPILYATGVVQTVPSIALLALMIPLFGIGQIPAMVALFIYGLLPIVRNTYVGLTGIDPSVLEAADGIGLLPSKKLRYVEIPLAMPVILAGIRTSAVINVGTATLAAFIGAGGLGEPIVTGLALADTNLILQGAIPAMMLAILVEYSLSLIEHSFKWKRVS